MKVTRTASTITITQQTYINDKLELFGFDNAKTMTTPEVVTKQRITSEADTALNDQEVNTYRMMVGSLIYASISTRPDITHAVNMISRHMSNPSHEHMIMVKRVFRYLSGTRTLGLLYNNENQHQGGDIELTGYCDADWGGDLTDRKSTTGYCTMMNGNLVSWQSKKQPTVALSSTEAEYMAINDVAKEIMWMRMILGELGLKVVTPTIIYVDNQPAIRISENDSEHDRTKHIDIRHYFIRDLIKNGDIKLQWISTNDQLADIFTKSLATPTFVTLRDQLMTKTKENQQRQC
jgi:hypothetical protein